MSAVRRLGRELCAALARFDPNSYGGNECAVIADELARVVKACETASARAAARAVECGAHKGSVADSLARAAGRSTGATRAALDAIEAVAACPATLEAAVAGEVSLAQAATIVTAPEHEAELLELARSSGLGVVKERARKRRLAAAINPEELHERQHAAQHVVHWTNDLGNVAFRGELPPEIGVPFVNRLDKETDRGWRAAKRAKRSVSRDVLTAEAFTRIVAGGGSQARGADVVIVADINAYRRGHAEPGEVGQIVGGGPIPIHVAREMAQDAFLKAVLHDGVRVHTVAHFGRHIPSVLRTALELGPVRDFDGVQCVDCDRKHGLEWDHDEERADGGTTSFENMVPRCRPDHWAKTQRERKARQQRQARGP